MYYCDDLEMKAIERVLRSKKLFRYQGKDVETECSTFEKSFAKFLKVKNTILLSSGTNALVTALFSAGVEEGDEVLIPAYTFFATAAAVMELKAIPVIVNINEFLSFDFQDMERKVTSKTKAIVAVHMDGYPCDMSQLQIFAEKNKLVLIEDVAQAIGGSYQNKKLGSIATFGCYSFNMDKIISCGEGGALAINDEALYQKSFLFHDSCNQFGPTVKDMYTISKFSGRSMRASEIQGAMINVQLERLPVILEDLKERKSLLDNKFQKLGMEMIPSYDSKGECGTTTRILCNDPGITNKLVLEFNKLGLRTNSPVLRPAHTVWQWHSLIPGSQPKFDYLPSIERLSKVLLVHVSLEQDLEQWSKLVETVTI